MVNRYVRHAASVLAVTATPLIMWAPIAGADDPQPCAPDDQQCQQQQNQGAGIANQVIDNVQRGLDQAGRPTQPTDQYRGTPSPNIGTGNGLLMRVNGVPTCVPFGTAPPASALLEPIAGSGNATFC